MVKPSKKPTIKELIASADYSKDVWTWKYIRLVGVLFVKVFIHLSLSANMVTVANIFVAFMGALFFSQCLYFKGFVFYMMYFVLDTADGELARYYGTSGYKGLYLDRLVHLIVEPMLFLSLSYGLDALWLGIIPALCCENGFRLVDWGYKVSYLDEGNGQKSFRTYHKESVLVDFVKFIAIYGFIWLVIIISLINVQFITWLLVIWSFGPR